MKIKKILFKMLYCMILGPLFPLIWIVPSDDGGSGDDSSSGDNSSSGDDSSSGDGSSSGDDSSSGDNNDNQTSNAITFKSQQELDNLISKRINKAVEKVREEQKKEKEKQEMTQAERLKAEKAEADEKATKAIESANVKLIKAKVIEESVKLKIVDPTAAVKLMDMEMVEVDEDGNVKGVEKSLKSLIKDKPYLINSGQNDPTPGGDDQNSGKTKKNNFDMNNLIRKATGR